MIKQIANFVIKRSQLNKHTPKQAFSQVEDPFKYQNRYNFNFKDWNTPSLKDKTIAEYIFLDGSGKNLRSKTRIIEKEVKSLEDIDDWAYDGSSTGQAVTENSEVHIKPVAYYRDPLRAHSNAILVLCEGYQSDKVTPALGNFRQVASKIFNDVKKHDVWFGFEQEFFFFEREGTTQRWPLGWPSGGFPYRQGRYYCGAGDYNIQGRAIMEAHLRACLEAGLTIGGYNAEVAAGQWEYQIGIAKGIELADQTLISRYLLLRIGEEFGVDVNFDPKPVFGDWNGSGGHMNMSTIETRSEGGLDVIRNHMKLLDGKHHEHMLVYGEGNTDRMTGAHETASYNKFTYGEGTRAASVRIGMSTVQKGKGFYEDRRPASNIDPYIVTGILADTTLLNSKYCDEIVKQYKDYAARTAYEAVILTK